MKQVMTCERCRFWEQHSERYGFCHRLPPRIVPDEEGGAHHDGEPATMHPSVSPHNWCGEFQQGQEQGDGDLETRFAKLEAFVKRLMFDIYALSLKK